MRFDLIVRSKSKPVCVWPGAELAGRTMDDARKIRIARRLRAETAVTLKRIAIELHMGNCTQVANRLTEKPT
jgi:hypothetical protein